MPSKPFAMIVNPNAGKKQGAQIAQEVTSRLKDSQIDVKIFTSAKSGQTLSLAKNLNVQEYQAVIVVGGDGSLFEVLNGLSKDGKIPLPIAQIPTGTGNSYIKDLGISSVDDGIKAIVSGQCRQVDMGYFRCSLGDFQFINLIGAGFVANVAVRAGKYKFLGSKSYLLAVLEELVFLKAIPVKLTIDGNVFEREAIFLEVCNSRLTGGDMMMAPDAKIDDGLLDVVLMNKTSRKRFLKLLPMIFTGAHVHEPQIETFRCKDIKIEAQQPMKLNADGEVFGETPLQVGLQPLAVQIFECQNGG